MRSDGGPLSPPFPSFIPCAHNQMSTRLTTQDAYKGVLDSYDTWLFDCDGVLWHDDRLIDGVIEVLKMLRRQSES